MNNFLKYVVEEIKPCSKYDYHYIYIKWLYIKDEILTCKAVWVTDTGQTFLLATWDHRKHICIITYSFRNVCY